MINVNWTKPYSILNPKPSQGKTFLTLGPFVIALSLGWYVVLGTPTCVDFHSVIGGGVGSFKWIPLHILLLRVCAFFTVCAPWAPEMETQINSTHYSTGECNTCGAAVHTQTAWLLYQVLKSVAVWRGNVTVILVNFKLFFILFVCFFCWFVFLGLLDVIFLLPECYTSYYNHINIQHKIIKELNTVCSCLPSWWLLYTKMTLQMLILCDKWPEN